MWDIPDFNGVSGTSVGEEIHGCQIGEPPAESDAGVHPGRPLLEHFRSVSNRLLLVLQEVCQCKERECHWGLYGAGSLRAFFLNPHPRICLLIFRERKGEGGRERERERERERNINV